MASKILSGVVKCELIGFMYANDISPERCSALRRLCKWRSAWAYRGIQHVVNPTKSVISETA